MNRNSRTLYFISLGAAICVISRPTHAYLDPATTSYIIQAVAGVFIAVGAVIGIFWKKIKMFFRDQKIKAMEKSLTRKAEKQEKR